MREEKENTTEEISSEKDIERGEKKEAKWKRKHMHALNVTKG